MTYAMKPPLKYDTGRKTAILGPVLETKMHLLERGKLLLHKMDDASNDDRHIVRTGGHTIRVIQDYRVNSPLPPPLRLRICVIILIARTISSLIRRLGPPAPTSWNSTPEELCPVDHVLGENAMRCNANTRAPYQYRLERISTVYEVGKGPWVIKIDATR